MLKVESSLHLKRHGLGRSVSLRTMVVALRCHCKVAAWKARFYRRSVGSHLVKQAMPACQNSLTHINKSNAWTITQETAKEPTSHSRCTQGKKRYRVVEQCSQTFVQRRVARLSPLTPKLSSTPFDCYPGLEVCAGSVY